MAREEEIKLIKEWYALPGYGKEGEVLDHECEWLLDRLEVMRRADKRDRR
jgi:hypothetical protein